MPGPGLGAGLARMDKVVPAFQVPTAEAGAKRLYAMKCTEGGKYCGCAGSFTARL